MEKSHKQKAMESRILKLLDPHNQAVASFMFADEEIAALQNYANTVSIKRLGFNDHGPVHMRIAAYNAIKVFDLLRKAGVTFCLEAENLGTVEDSLTCVLIASLLHDTGMSVARDKHEYLSIILAKPIIERILEKFYPDDFTKRVILRSLTIEGILGHMATRRIHSLEAGLVLIGDGCDMKQGRARIPAMLSDTARAGDIHRYSSAAVVDVKLTSGKERPVSINITMTESVGFFQVEEVLIPKISMSPVKNYIELWAGLKDEQPLRYL